MRELLTYVLLLVVCFGCVEQRDELKSEVNATIFYGSKLKNERFDLIINKTDTLLNYRYASKIDTLKTIYVQKLVQTGTLKFNSEKFIKINKQPYKNEKIEGVEFDF